MFHFYIGALYFIFGAIIGSFLNVVILREGTNMGIFGRSVCFSCGKKLSFYELIPIFSFLTQRGKCLNCRSRISAQYPLVEALTAFLFLLIFLSDKNMPIDEPYSYFLRAVYFMAVFAILIIISAYDARHKIIPNKFVYPFIIFSAFRLFYDFSGPFSLSLPSPQQFVAGPLLFLILFSFWFFSGGKWMGLGDAKLALGVGWILGLGLGISALVLSFWMGALFGVSLILFRKIRAYFGTQKQLSLDGKQITMKSEIPFAPFIVAGFFVEFFLRISILIITF